MVKSVCLKCLHFARVQFKSMTVFNNQYGRVFKGDGEREVKFKHKQGASLSLLTQNPSHSPRLIFYSIVLTHCSRKAALRRQWSSSSDARKINFFLFGVKSVNYDINCTLFREVQIFIINTNRFSMATV